MAQITPSVPASRANAETSFHGPSPAVERVPRPARAALRALRPDPPLRAAQRREQPRQRRLRPGRDRLR